MAKTTVETRTDMTIKALADWVSYPHAHKLSRYEVVACAAGFSEGKPVNMLRILEYINKLYIEGAIE